MPQITLSIPQEKLPLLQEFLNVLGIDGKQLQSMFRKPRNSSASKQVAEEHAISWEYYCNELEFE